MLLVCAVTLIDMKRRYHDALCGSGECDGDGQFSVQRLSTWHRRSPVAIPKSYLGRGLEIDPRRLRQTMRQQWFFSPTAIFHFTCQMETNHVILLPQLLQSSSCFQ
jgi:hypothetical protein